MKAVEKITKELYGTEYHPSSGKMKEFEPRTHKYIDVDETGVYGRFARLRQLDAFKSNAENKAVYYTLNVCMIKVDNPTSKDVVSTVVNAENVSQLSARFAGAWDEFKKIEKQQSEGNGDPQTVAEKRLAALQKAREAKKAKAAAAKKIRG